MSDRIDHGSRPWKAIPRDVLRDPHLSPRAKGGLVTLLSHDPGWIRSAIAVLMKENGSCGRQEARKIMRELVDLGYAELTQTRDSGGRFKTGYTVYPERQVQASEPGSSPGAVPRESVSPGAVPRSTEVEPPDVEPREEKNPTPEGQKTSPPASNGKGKDGEPFHLADVLNLGLIVSLKDRYRRRKAWDGVTPGLLTALVLGGKNSPAYGARAVNAAIDDLYENAGDVANPSGYLRERAEAHSLSPSQTGEPG